MNRNSLGCLVLLAFAGGCATRKPADTRAADEAAIRELDVQWSKAAGANDVNGSVAYYTDDAYLLPPNAPMAIGTNAIRQSWAGLLGPGVAVSWTVSKVEVAAAGDMAYLVGTYKLTMKNPPLADRGKIMEVWKKQADGKWKCVADTYNSDVPLPAAK